MPSKLDLLREGRAVEIEPGVKARLNKQKRALELSTGEVRDVSNDPDYFPQGSQQLGVSRHKERIRGEVAKSPYGEFGYLMGQKGIPGSANDWIDYSSKPTEDYLALKQAQHQVTQEISEESPWTSAGATAASIVPEIALTHRLPGVVAAPLLTAATAGSRVATEPGRVLGEAGIASVLGLGIDKAAGYLNRVKLRRGAARDLPKQQEAVRTQNLAGEQAAQTANAQEKQAYNVLTQRTKNENAALLHQHQLTLNDRQNKMIAAQNAYETAKTGRDAEVLRLKNASELAKSSRSAEAARLDNEYKAAKASAEQENKRLLDQYKLEQKLYEESVRNTPHLQKQAQEEYSRNVINNVERIEKVFPKDSRIIGRQIGVDEFINEMIDTTGLAASREGAQASRILRSLFPEGDMLTAKELAKRYRGIEEAIQRSSPEVQGVLNQFKTHLGERLPTILEDSIAHAKIMPTLARQIEKDISLVIKDIPFGKGEEAVKTLLTKTANANLKQLMREIGPEDFVRKLQSGELGNIFKQRLLSTEDFLTDAGFNNFAKMRKQGTYELAERTLNDRHNFFMNEIGKRIDNTLARNEIKAMQAGKEASRKIKRDVKNTYGIAEPIAPPMAPNAPEALAMPAPPTELPPITPPQMPPPVMPPQTLPMPPAPAINAAPGAPTPRTFAPQPEPTLAPPQGSAERMGQFLEDKPLMRGRAKNPLLGLGYLKELARGARIAPEAALRGLTSPTEAGEIARISFKRGGIEAIETWAQRYPSYHDGILENPQERRSLTKEVEDDPEIPLEQKALIQSKINRGRPLQERIQ